jgi:NADPH:quinone reductase-like Zn-dependent oxidoreductase
MRAVRHRRYGGPERLTIEELPEPEPGDGEVRVRVHAASLNALDWHLMRADPVLVRAMAGPFRPRDPRMGVDLAGTITAVGPGASPFAIGDEVFGPATGTFAESVIARARDILPIPTGVSMVDAAALPVAGFTALQALRDWGGLSSGGTVLVHGASGGVGHLAVQLARTLGASRVDAVTRAGSMEFASQLGADEVIDYDRVDVTRLPARYDVIIDCGGTRPMADMQAILHPRGTLVNVGAVEMNRWFGPLIRERRAKALSREDARIGGRMASWNVDDLRVLADRARVGALRPGVSETFPLDGIREAMTRLEAGGIRGKLVLLPE